MGGHQCHLFLSPLLPFHPRCWNGLGELSASNPGINSHSLPGTKGPENSSFSCLGPYGRSSVRFPPKRKHFRSFDLILGEGRLNGCWWAVHHGSRYEKSSLYRLGHQSATFGNTAAAAEPAWSKVSDSEAGRAPVFKADTPPLRQSPEVKCCYMPTAGMHGLLWIHPKIGSTLRSQEDGLGQRVSPLMSPFARAKPKVLNDLGSLVYTAL